MFEKVKNNLDAFNLTKKMLRKVQKFCHKVYSNILNGDLYLEYLNGLRESIRIDLGDALFKNKVFMEKYQEYLKNKIATVESQLTNPGVMEAHSEYMNLLINYSVYRKLFGKEDEKIHKAIWSLQKHCPLLILYNNLYVSPGNFLSTICPLTKKFKGDPVDLRLFLNQ